MSSSSSVQLILIIFQYFAIVLAVQSDTGKLNEENSEFSNISQLVTQTEKPFPVFSFSNDGYETITEAGSYFPRVPQLRNDNNVRGCSCGQRNKLQSRIVGGVEAQPNEFPWRCYVQLEGGVCGCSLISNSWVMTAAHCPVFGGRIINIALGAHTLGDQTNVSMTATSKRVIIHPKFNTPPFANDISLIELSSPITPSREISPVCLPWNMTRQTFAGSIAVTSGWGRTNGTSFLSDALRTVKLPVVSNRQCARVIGQAVKISNGILCGFRTGRGTCMGDSGGSIDLKRNSHYYAIGVASFTDTTCQSYSVFARVTHFLNWIQDTTREDFCRI